MRQTDLSAERGNGRNIAGITSGSVEHGERSASLVVLQLDPPSPDCRPHRFEGVAADSRREVHIDAAYLSTALRGRNV